MKRYMKTLVIFGHPSLEQSKVSATWVKQFEDSGKFDIHKLQDVYKNGHYNVEEEQKLIVKYDRLVVVFPTFWYNAPALAKQWLEEVFVNGWACNTKGPTAVEGKELVIATSCGSPAEFYHVGSFNNHPLDMFYLSWQQTAKLCKMQYKPLYALYAAPTKSQAEIEKAGELLIKTLSEEVLVGINSL